MKFFHIRPNVTAFADAVIYPFGEMHDSLYDFFLLENTNIMNLPNNIVAKCQPGISEINLSELDYFYLYGGIPIFSDRFVEEAKKVGLEMDFYKSIIVAKNTQRELYIGRILNRMHILDCDKSRLGTDYFFAGTYIKEDIDTNFYIVRELNPLLNSRFIVSERFKDWANNYNFSIKYNEVANVKKN